MLNIPDSVKALFKQDGVRKNFRAHFPNGELPDITNDNIVKESVNFTESICSQDVFKFGLSEASVIEFETVGVGNMYGMTMECGIEIDCSSLSAADIADIEAGTWDGEFVPLADSDLGFPFFRVPYGVFTVDSCPRNHEAMTHRKVTAYSASYSDASYNLPWFPDNMLVPKLSVAPDAFIRQVTRQGLVETSTAAGTGIKYLLYDSNGNPYSIATALIGDSRSVAPTGVAGWRACFFETDLEWDEADSRAVGNDIADQLTAAGYDFTYDAKKRKIYLDNRQALENACPMLFGPSLCAAGADQVVSGGETNIYNIDNLLYWYHVNRKNTLYPILCSVSYGKAVNDNAAFIGLNMPCKYTINMTRLVYYTAPTESPVFRLIDSSYQTFCEITPTVNVPTLDANASVKFYTYTAQSFPRIPIDNMGVAYKKQIKYEKTLGSWVTRNLTVYSYVDALDRIKVTNSIAELNAQFGRVNRKGEAEFIRLDASAPLAILPGEYMSLWWDEFEVEPIGTVRYGYEADGEQVKLDYNFGNGASLYDMSDNEVFRLASGADQASVVFALYTDFVPHVDPINFVPIDFEMKGLPYLEAGDALAITAQDGAVVNSYALRIEISGVQALQMEIESQSGLIIDSGEAAT